jgi:hypothetical protein
MGEREGETEYPPRAYGSQSLSFRSFATAGRRRLTGQPEAVLPNAPQCRVFPGDLNSPTRIGPGWTGPGRDGPAVGRVRCRRHR